MLVATTNIKPSDSIAGKSENAVTTDAQHRDSAAYHIAQFTPDSKAEAEGLRGELARTKSEHERKTRESRCKIFVSACSGIAGVLTGIGSIIYAVNRCR